MSGWRVTLLGIGMLFLGFPASFAENNLEAQLERRLGAGDELDMLLPALLAGGHDPQQVAQALLERLPWEAPRVAAILAVQDPTAAPFIASAVSAIALADPAPVAAAVASAVPSLAPEVSASACLTLPDRAQAVVAAVVEAVPGAAPEVLAASVAALPDQAGVLLSATLGALQQHPASEIHELLPVLAQALGQAVPARIDTLSGPLLAAADALQLRVAVLVDLLAGAGVAGPAEMPGLLLALSGELSSSADAAALTPGQRLSAPQRLHLSAPGRVVFLGHSMSCALMGPATLDWAVLPRLESGLLRCAGPQWQLAWPGGELHGEAADVLLAVGPEGAGLVVFAGAVSDSLGRTWPPGSHYLDDLHDEDSAAPARLSGWLAQLGLAGHPLGDLGEPVLWVAAQLLY